MGHPYHSYVTNYRWTSFTPTKSHATKSPVTCPRPQRRFNARPLGATQGEGVERSVILTSERRPFFLIDKEGISPWSVIIPNRSTVYMYIYMYMCICIYIYVYVYIRIVQPHIINQDVVWKRLGFSHHLDSEGEHLGLVFFSTGEITAAEMGITSGKNGDFLLLNGTSKCDLMDYEWDIPSGKLYNSLRTGKWP